MTDTLFLEYLLEVSCDVVWDGLERVELGRVHSTILSMPDKHGRYGGRFQNSAEPLISVACSVHLALQ